MADVAIVASFPWRRKLHLSSASSPATLAASDPGGRTTAAAKSSDEVTPHVGRTDTGTSQATRSSRRARDVRARISQLAAVVAATKMQRRRSVSFADAHRLSSSREYGSDAASAVSVAALERQFATVMAPFEAIDVELLVRLEVAKAENHAVGHGHRREEHVVLTTEAVERITWLFACLLMRR